METQSVLLVQEDRKRAEVTDGFHYGFIVDVKVNEHVSKTGGKYNYLDLQISVNDCQTKEDLPITKVGYPLPISPSSYTGELLKRFGIDVVPGTKADVDSLLNKQVQFSTQKKGKYVEVDRGSVRPFTATVVKNG